MSYQVERDTFISQAAREGLTVDVARKLLRYATTLQRLSEAQCNGDWPYNGDRDRPANQCTCSNLSGQHNSHCLIAQRSRHDSRYTVCPKCEASGVSKSSLRWSSDFGKDAEVKSVDGAKVMVAERMKVCPDCRTQELVNELLDTLPKGRVWECIPCMHTWFAEVRLSEHTSRLSGEATEYCPICVKRAGFGSEVRPLVVAHFNGDPRGAVLVLSTPGYPWTEDGRGRGLYVPAGKSR